MIPKIIHYCWFGGNPLPELAEKCIESWKKYCPDYEIRRWDESNFDINCCDYVKEAYQEKKWAFVSDVARLYALVNFGGIYMDTDVEVINSIDSLLKYNAVSGFESDTEIPTGLMACEKNNVMFKELLEQYYKIHFLLEDGSMDLTTNVIRITNTCLKYGFVPNNKKQTVNTLTLLPRDYLCPKDFSTRKINITSNTLTIHHFSGSWLTEKDHYRIDLQMKLQRVIPCSKVCLFASCFIAEVKFFGVRKALKESILWVKKRCGKK